MKAGLILTMITMVMANQLVAQQVCRSSVYLQDQLQKDPSLASKIHALEKFTQQYQGNNRTGRIESNVIKIPVVVHILYHYPTEKISDEQVLAQLDILNKCFRKLNADTINTPAIFKPLAADCEIEFQLATSDPRSRYTNGIVRKYTPVTKWTNDDKMKFSAEMGDDAWDTRSYLNIWMCNLDKFAGYSSFPGGDENVDGIVLGFSIFASQENKTIVHETGHWLNLKHLWGDEYCGEDGVNDTPKQASYTLGCPTGIRITCGNAPTGDMYMNYMDFTDDFCTNLFTLGQKARMQSLFVPGGARHAILSSKGLNPPLIFEIPIPEEDPKWLAPRMYPNPATNELNIDLAYDMRWIGNVFRVINLQGQVVMTVTITSKVQKINISHLSPGMYFLAAKKEDGVSVKYKFIKL